LVFGFMGCGLCFMVISVVDGGSGDGFDGGSLVVLEMAELPTCFGFGGGFDTVEAAR
jgi:hypothetical protein